MLLLGQVSLLSFDPRLPGCRHYVHCVPDCVIDDLSAFGLVYLMFNVMTAKDRVFMDCLLR